MQSIGAVFVKKKIKKIIWLYITLATPTVFTKHIYVTEPYWVDNINLYTSSIYGQLTQTHHLHRRRPTICCICVGDLIMIIKQ